MAPPAKVFFTVTASRSSALQFPVYGFFPYRAWRVELRETVFGTFVGSSQMVYSNRLCRAVEAAVDLSPRPAAGKENPEAAPNPGQSAPVSWMAEHLGYRTAYAFPDKRWSIK